MILELAAALLLQIADERRDKLAARVEEIRGVRFERPIPVRKGSRKEQAAGVVANARLVYGEDLKECERGLKALGLIPGPMNLQRVLEMGSPPAYNTGGAIALLKEDVPDDEIVYRLALELAEQRHDLAGRARALGANFDAQMALSATRQGACDMTKQLFWAGRKLDEPHAKEHLPGLIAGADKWEHEESRGSLAALVAPRLFVRGADFAWRRGGIFMETMRRAGGMAASAKALAHPPASTEQVLHPEKYVAGESPVVIDSEPLDVFLAARGFKRVWGTTLGELGTAIVLETHIKEDVRPVSVGWGGDVLRYYENGDGQGVVAWAVAWDSEDDAREFEGACGKLIDALPPREGSMTIVARRGSSVGFFVNVPGAIREGAAEALWKCTARRGARASTFGE